MKDVVALNALWMCDVNDSCLHLATGEGAIKKISELQVGVEPMRSSCSSVVRASDQHSRGHGFDSYL